MEHQIFHDAELAAAYLIDLITDGKKPTAEEATEMRSHGIDIQGVTDYVTRIIGPDAHSR